jgi:hypothetical protein
LEGLLISSLFAISVIGIRIRLVYLSKKKNIFLIFSSFLFFFFFFFSFFFFLVLGGVIVIGRLFFMLSEWVILYIRKIFNSLLFFKSDITFRVIIGFVIRNFLWNKLQLNFDQMIILKVMRMWNTCKWVLFLL